MKGKGLGAVKNDVKHWVVKRTKSGKDGEGGFERSASGREKGKRMERMDVSAEDGKTTFTVKGTVFRVDGRYGLKRALGTGAYGVVCSAVDGVAGGQVAIKKVQGVFDDQTDAKRIIREIRLLASMKHVNILRITDIDEPEAYSAFNDVYIMTELMDTDLNKLLRSKHPLLDSQRKFFTCQMFRALKYIHSANILHRDLKPANVLVSENCDLKICDFGLARYVDPEDTPDQAMTEYVVTRWYRAPELLLAGDEYSAAIDMWSAGCLIAELYSRRPIFPGRDVKNQIEKICQVLGKPNRDQIRSIPNPRARDFLARLPDLQPVNLADVMKDACPAAIDLVQRLLQFDPKDRITAAQALSHPYVAEYRDEDAEHDADPGLSLEALEPPSEKKLGRDGVRRLMWNEMLRFHPDARAREPPEAASAQRKVQNVLASMKGG